MSFLEPELNPQVAAAIELLISHGWKWEGRGLQPSWQPYKPLFMHKLHKEEAPGCSKTEAKRGAVL